MATAKKVNKISTDLSELFRLDSLGNSPYFSNGVSKEIRKILEEYKNIKVSEDEFALYVKVGNQSLPPLIVETHIDHPGFVVGSDNLVHSLGSFINSKFINKINFPKQLPVNFFTWSGLPLTKGYLFDIKTEGNQITARYFAENFTSLPANTQVFPIIKTGQEKDRLFLKSADNLATVFVCLQLIKNLHASENCNLTIIFSKLEEIYQLSATGIAKRGTTPFEKILPNTPILVLEVSPVLTRSQHNNGDLAVVSNENIFSTLNKNSLLLKQIVGSCKVNNTNLHYVTLKSHGDSIAFRLVGKNKETICLTVNNFNRHNIDEKGNFVAEEVSLDSLLQMTKVVTEVATNISKSTTSDTIKLVLTEQENKKRKQLLSAFTRAYPRLKYQKLYPKTIKEYLSFAYYSLLAKLV